MVDNLYGCIQFCEVHVVFFLCLHFCNSFWKCIFLDFFSVEGVCVGDRFIGLAWICVSYLFYLLPGWVICLDGLPGWALIIIRGFAVHWWFRVCDWPGWGSGSRGLFRCYVLGLAWMGARCCDTSRSRQKLKHHVFPKLAMSHCVFICMKMNFSCSFSEEISRLTKSIK